MKFQFMPEATIDSDDPEEMREAIRLLDEAGINVKKPSPCQLKLDERTSYYPRSGTLLEDGKRAHPQRGIAVLRAWIRKQSLRVRLEE